jgi:hypothetical protein
VLPLAKAGQQARGINSTPNKTGAFIHHSEELRFASLIDSRNINQVDYAGLVDAIASRRVPARGQFIDVLSSKPALQNPCLHVRPALDRDSKRSECRGFSFAFHAVTVRAAVNEMLVDCQTPLMCSLGKIVEQDEDISA